MTNNRSHIAPHLSESQMLDYLNNRLSPGEMHAVEKHLLNCAFCEDAMEGLERIDNERILLKDLDDLKNSLAERVNKKERRIGIYWKYGAAASVLLLLTAGLYLYVSDNIEENKKQGMAVQYDHVEEEKKEHADVIIRKDSLREETVSADNEAAMKPVLDIAPPPKVMKNEVVREVSSAASAPPPVMDEIIEETDEAEMISMEEDAGAPLNRDKESKAEEVNEQFKDAEIVTPKKEDTFDSAPQIERHATSLTPTYSAPQKSMESVDLSSVTVKKSKKSEQGETYDAKPTLSEQEYNILITKSIRYPAAARENRTEGVVKVSFIVGTDGKLDSFKVKRGIGDGCDEEAIRVLKEGPAWEPARKNGELVEQRMDWEVEFTLPVLTY